MLKKRISFVFLIKTMSFKGLTSFNEACFSCFSYTVTIRLNDVKRSTLRAVKVHYLRPFYPQLNVNELINILMFYIRLFTFFLASETSFCGDKANGNYQAPSSCQGYIACSNGVTSHVACPAGQTFDTDKKICQSESHSSCFKACRRSQIRLRGNLNRELCKLKKGGRRSRFCSKVSTLKKKQLQQQQ